MLIAVSSALVFKPVLRNLARAVVVRVFNTRKIPIISATVGIISADYTFTARTRATTSTIHIIAVTATSISTGGVGKITFPI